MLVALLLALAAPAQGLSLDWQAPAGCPEQATVRARVVAMLGAGATSAADLTATGRVSATGEGWRLELSLVRAAGREQRTLVDSDCAALADAAALVIAVTIDPLAGVVLPQERAAVVPEAVVPEVVVPEVVVPVARDGGRGAVPEDRSAGAVPKDRALPVEEPRGTRRRLGLGLRAGGGLGFTRILPAVHGVLELGLGLEGRRWRVELNGWFAPPVRGTASSQPAIGGSFRLGFAELRGCGVPALRRVPLAFPLCAGLQVGAMYGRGEGSGLMLRQSARSPWVATRIGGALRWRPRGTRVGLWLSLDAIVAITRPSFATAGKVLVHEAARFGGQATLGFEVRLR